MFQYLLYQAGFLIIPRIHQVNSSKCESNVVQISKNPSLLIDPSFKEVKRVFLLSI